VREERKEYQLRAPTERA